MSDKSRRKLLKSIAAGSGAIVAGKSLPESWSRPVVDSVMLPAHAQTSIVVGSYFNEELFGVVPDSGLLQEQNNMFAEVINYFIPNVNAGILPPISSSTACATATADNVELFLQAIVEGEDSCELSGGWDPVTFQWQATLPRDGTPVAAPITSPCAEASIPFPGEPNYYVKSVTADACVIGIIDGSDITIDSGPCNTPPSQCGDMCPE
jgi:hypothetical protein